MNTARWHRRYLNLAKYVADEWSKDPTTKVGAVVIGENPKNLTVGYNGFPPGVDDSYDRLSDRQMKYKYMIHAERNALDNATFETRGGTLASTMFPCVECAKSIISRGIECVVAPPPPPPIAEPSWRDDLIVSLAILQEAGVRIVYMEPGDDSEKTN